jgi:Domain of unknown function (DUF5134)
MVPSWAVAALCGLATALCLVRCLHPGSRQHALAVDAWHLLMGLAMVAMLLTSVSSRSAALQVVVFAGAALWCGVHLLAGRMTAAYARLGLASAVMAGMLLPAALPSPAGAAPAMAGHDHSGTDMSGMGMSGTAMGSSSSSGSHAMAMPPTWLAGLMLVALAVVVLLALRAAVSGEDQRPTTRAGLAGEVLMAGAMGWMVAGAL